MTKKSDNLVELKFEKDSGFVGTVKYISLSFSGRARAAAVCGITTDENHNYSFGDNQIITIALMGDLVEKQVKEIDLECVNSGERYCDLESLSHSEDAAGFFNKMGLRLIIGKRVGKNLPSK